MTGRKLDKLLCITTQGETLNQQMYQKPSTQWMNHLPSE